jgi:hypothetical protein
MQRIFGLLSLIYTARLVDVVVHDLKSSNRQAKANAMEIIDNMFDAETRSYLLPALDTIPLREKIERGLKYFKLRERSIEDLVESYLESGDTWLTTCTLQALAENGLKQYQERVRFFIDHEDPLMRETALYTLARLAPPEVLKPFLAAGANDPESPVRSYARWLAGTV